MSRGTSVKCISLRFKISVQLLRTKMTLHTELDLGKVLNHFQTKRMKNHGLTNNSQFRLNETG
jgi:hypothetical protein